MCLRFRRQFTRTSALSCNFVVYCLKRCLWLCVFYVCVTHANGRDWCVCVSVCFPFRQQLNVFISVTIKLLLDTEWWYRWWRVMLVDDVASESNCQEQGNCLRKKGKTNAILFVINSCKFLILEENDRIVNVMMRPVINRVQYWNRKA